MKEFTCKDFSDLYFRKRKLHEAAVGIMELVSGTGLKISPYMEDENGKYSEKRTLATIEELLKALKTYLRFERAEEIHVKNGREENGLDAYEYKYYEMQEEEIACYRGFLYCALRELYANYDYYGGGEAGTYRRVFEELIEVAKDQKIFPSYHNFLHNMYVEKFASIPQILFSTSVGVDADSIELLTETRHRVAAEKEKFDIKNSSHQNEFQAYYMATDEEMEKLLQSLTAEEREKVDHRLQEYDEIQKAEAEYYESEEVREDYIEEDPEITEIYAREDEKRKKYEKKYAREFDYFESYQKHLDQYLHLQHLRGTPEQFQDAIIGMVDFFLLAKNKSCFGNPTLFYKVLANMQHLSRQITSMIRENKV